MRHYQLVVEEKKMKANILTNTVFFVAAIAWIAPPPMTNSKPIAQLMSMHSVSEYRITQADAIEKKLNWTEWIRAKLKGTTNVKPVLSSPVNSR